MTPDLFFIVVGNIYSERSIMVVPKLRFLISNLIFLFTCTNFSGQDISQTDSLSLKRRENLNGEVREVEFLDVAVLEHAF